MEEEKKADHESDFEDEDADSSPKPSTGNF